MSLNRCTQAPRAVTRRATWRRCCASARQQTDELGCLTRPAATDLDPEDEAAFASWVIAQLTS